MKTAKGQVQADFGIGKRFVTITAELAPGVSLPPGQTTAGSTFRLDQGPGSSPQECTTTAGPAGSTSSSCGFLFIDDSTTLTLTQTFAPAPLTSDPVSQVVGPCSNSTRAPSCNTVSLVFSLGGPRPPAASPDTAVMTENQSIPIDVLANDDTFGQSVTGLTITTSPAHGTAVIDNSAAGHPMIIYTPAAGYTGTDSVGYTIETAEGTATSTATITVKPTPTPTPTPTVTSPTATGSASSSSPTSEPTAEPTTAKPSPTHRSSSIAPAVVMTGEAPAGLAPGNGLASTGASSGVGLLAALGLVFSGGGLAALRGAGRGRRAGHAGRAERPGRHARRRRGHHAR